MRRSVLRRLAMSGVLLFTVSLLTFALQAAVPGDAARTILGNNTDPAAYEELRIRLGLNHSLPVRYWDWLTHALRGDFGSSPISGLSVGGEIGHRLPVTLSLILGATVVSAALGVGLGIVSAVRGGALGRAVDVLSLAGSALPNFWLALALVDLFAVTVRLFPATGYVALADDPGQWLRSLVLPVATLALPSVAVFAKQTRDTMLDVLAHDFVTTLRANGASERSVLFRHALRNAAIPLVALLGLTFVGLLSGTVFVESVFAMPGLGGLAVQAATAHDVLMIQGVVVVFTLLVAAVNLLVDIAYGWIDPKVRMA